MLRTINPSLLRPSMPDGVPGHEAASDPAGFSSLLRQQTQASVPAPTAAQPPAPIASRAASHDPAPAHEATKASTGTAAPAPDAESHDSGETADATDAAAEAPARARGIAPRPKLRNADATTRAPGGDAAAPSEPSTADPIAPGATAAPDSPAHGATGAAHAAVADWLAALQQRTAPAAKDAPAASDGRDDTARTKKLPAAVGGEAASSDINAAHRGATPAERSDAAPAFAAALAEQRTVDAPHSRAETPSVAALGAAGPGAPSPLARDAGAAVAVALPTPIDAPDFAQTLGLQMSVLAKDGVQQAELHLNPAEMGPVSVQIVMDGTQARIDFGADVAATRQAIEAGLPELASALRDAGYTLAGGGVSQHAGSRQGQSGGSPSDEGPSRRGGAKPVQADAITRAGQAARRIVSRGGVDLYA